MCSALAPDTILARAVVSPPAAEKPRIPTISVLIPTWRRPAELARCLAALNRQTQRPDQVVVTVRQDDDATQNLLQELSESGGLPVYFEMAIVGPVKLTAAMDAGLKRTTGDLVAFTDDDAEPRTDWLQRCRAALDADPNLAGVGGRDWQPHERWNEQRVGTISWYGRGIGNHHLGAGPARDVDILKGVNACFRGDLLREVGFDSRLRGTGNVSHWEMSLCLALRHRGWRLEYDPSIAVEHWPAPRHDGDVNARGGFEAATFVDAVHNETLALLSYLSVWQRPIFLLWAILMGTSAEPGLAQCARLLMTRPRVKPLSRLVATYRGRIQGVCTFFKSNPQVRQQRVSQ